MTEIPELVQDKIWWYGWRNRMMKLNEDFRKNTMFDELFLYFRSEIVVKLYDELEYANVKTMVTRFHNIYKTIELSSLLPKRYYYSSGLRDPTGYKDSQEWINLEVDEYDTIMKNFGIDYGMDDFFEKIDMYMAPYRRLNIGYVC